MPPAFITKLSDYMFTNYAKDGGKLLVHMGAAGWILSSAAQISMLAFDKKIDKKQKKFLIPQEGADALVNCGMYYTICALIKSGSDHIVEKGKMITDEVVNALLKIKPDSMPAIAPNEWKKLFTQTELKGKLTKLLENADKLDCLKHLTQDQKAPFIEASQAALEKLYNYKNGMGVVAAIGASILACNIVTPFVRNKLASAYQKHALKKESVEVRKMQITNNITLKSPLPSSFKRFNNYNSFGNVKI